MSTGFPVDACGGRNRRSSSTVPGSSSGIVSPFASQVSAQRDPEAPAFVTIATRSPRGGA